MCKLDFWLNHCFKKWELFSAVRQTHNLFLVESSAAVGGGEGGGAGLAVPRHVPVLRAAANGQSVDAVGVAITVAAVLLSPAVT